MKSTYGVSGDKMYYEPADADAADRERLVHDEVPRLHVPKLFEALRCASAWTLTCCTTSIIA
jgi:mannonate dehydratase